MPNIFGESKEGEDTLIYHRMDIVWGYLRQPLPLLNKIALAVLTIPQSNAAEERERERVFSMISKNKTVVSTKS